MHSAFAKITRMIDLLITLFYDTCTQGRMHARTHAHTEHDLLFLVYYLLIILFL